MPERFEFSSKYPGIIIQKDDLQTSAFHLTIKELLTMIISKPVGEELVDTLSKKGKSMTFWNNGKLLIKRSKVNTVTIGKPGEEGGNKCVRVSELDACNGTGSASYIEFNPNIWVVPGQGPRPPYIALAHEMIHALHNALGTAIQEVAEEENMTVGIGKFTSEEICENAIRSEHNVVRRDKY